MAITETIQAKEFMAGAPDIKLKGDLRLKASVDDPFYRDNEGQWKEVSEYINNQHGLKRVNTLVQEDLGTGIHRYLLIAVNTSSLITRIKYSTVVINP